MLRVRSPIGKLETFLYITPLVKEKLKFFWGARVLGSYDPRQGLRGFVRAPGLRFQFRALENFSFGSSKCEDKSVRKEVGALWLRMGGH